MLTMIAAAALAAAPTPAANDHAQHMQMGQMSGMDMSQMDHGKTDHSKMADCCKHGANGKMECSMPDKAGAASAHQGHSN